MTHDHIHIYSWKGKCKFAQENIYSIVMSCVVVTKCQKEFGMSCTIASHQSIQKKEKHNWMFKCVTKCQKSKHNVNVQVHYKVSLKTKQNTVECSIVLNSVKQKTPLEC
jgi:hypothetical protein